MSIPDAAVAHITPIWDPRLEAYILERIERTWVPGADACAVATAVVSRLYDSLIPRGTDEPLRWRGSRASGIHQCELAQVRAVRIAHLPEPVDARSAMILHAGHFFHAWFQAQLIGERWEGGRQILLPDNAPIEETWPQEGVSPPWMFGLSGHSDQRFPPGHPAIPGINGLVADYKTMGVAASRDDAEHKHDGYLNFCIGARPKNEYIVQATVYAIDSQSEQAAIVAINMNRTIPAAYRKRWDEWAKATEATYGAKPSTFIHVLRFPADPRIAAGAADKARRIRAHVEAGTEPQCEVKARGESRICWDCRRVDAAIAALADQPFPDETPEDPRPQTWTAPGPDGAAARWERWASKVVGRTFRGIDDAQVLALVKPGARMRLEWDWQNPDGPRLPSGHAAAIKVIHEPSNTWLGFLPSRQSPTASKVALMLQSRGQVWAEVAELTAGTPDRPSVGINLYITGNIPA